MATEVSFAQSFLALLDTKPQNITADHVEDPKNYPASTPFTLPRHQGAKPYRKRSVAPPSTSASPAPGGTPSSAPAAGDAVTVKIRSMRNPPLDLTLPTPQPIHTTSVLEVKNAVSTGTGIPLDKIKLLYAKKPAADSKTLKDLLAGADATEIEFSVMIMGGAATLAAAAEAKAAGQKRPASEAVAETEAPVAQGLSGTPVLETEQFWEDLKGFLQQRIRDEKAAEVLLGRFRGAWSASS